MSFSLHRASAAMATAGSSRSTVLSLYRLILRTAESIPSYNHRGHVLQKARASFRANAGLHSPEEVEFAVSLADTQLEQLRSQVKHMRQIMEQTNTLTHTPPKPDRMYEPRTTPVGQARRSYHTTSIRSAEPSTAAASTTAAEFFNATPVDPATVTPIAPIGMPQPAEMLLQQSSYVAPMVATHIVHVLLTANNTIVTLTTHSGDTKAWASSGTCGFKNAKKSTYMACIAAGEQLGAKARNQNIRAVDMHISGFHKNKKAVLKGLMKAGLNVVAIRDTTPIPFNGCKPKKMRRL